MTTCIYDSMLNTQSGGKSHFHQIEQGQRINQERREYIDRTFFHVCGAPIFEFGLWPYVPHTVVILISVIFLVLYKSSMQLEMHIFTAYLVLGVGFTLASLIIVGLGMGASRNIEEFARKKAQKNKQVIQVGGDESKRGCTVSQNLRHGDVNASMRRRGMQNTIDERYSAIMNPVSWGANDIDSSDQSYQQSKMLRALSKADDPESSVLDDVEAQKHEEHNSVSEESDLSFSASPYQQHQKRQYRAVTRAVTSKIVEATVMMTITFVWLIYGVLFASYSSGQDFFPVSINISLAIFAFGLTQTSYIQSWYDNIIARYVTFTFWAAALLLNPTSNGNVPSADGVMLLTLVIRLVFFFLIYCLAEADTTAQINYWLRFCNRKKLIRNLPKLVSPPIEQIDTPGKRRVYAIQRIVFQSMYVLFLPWIIWPFAGIHMFWLIIRIRTTIAENNEGMMKKYEDISIQGSGLLESGSTKTIPEGGYTQDSVPIVLEGSLHETTAPSLPHSNYTRQFHPTTRTHPRYGGDIIPQTHSQTIPPTHPPNSLHYHTMRDHRHHNSNITPSIQQTRLDSSQSIAQRFPSEELIPRTPDSLSAPSVPTRVPTTRRLTGIPRGFVGKVPQHLESTERVPKRILKNPKGTEPIGQRGREIHPSNTRRVRFVRVRGPPPPGYLPVIPGRGGVPQIPAHRRRVGRLTSPMMNHSQSRGPRVLMKASAQQKSDMTWMNNTDEEGEETTEKIV